MLLPTIANAVVRMEIREDILALLVRKRPSALCASEISVELILPLDEVHSALRALKRTRQARPVGEPAGDEMCQAWEAVTN